MTGREHFHKAERLLALAEEDRSIARRTSVLAEAQVHATLAVAAAASENYYAAGGGQRGYAQKEK